MKKFSQMLRMAFALCLLCSMACFCSSCKSEGEKLAAKMLDALEDGDLKACDELEKEVRKLSEEEQDKAKKYFEENMPEELKALKKLAEE